MIGTTAGARYATTLAPTSTACAKRTVTAAFLRLFLIPSQLATTTTLPNSQNAKPSWTGETDSIRLPTQRVVADVRTNITARDAAAAAAAGLRRHHKANPSNTRAPTTMTVAASSRKASTSNARATIPAAPTPRSLQRPRLRLSPGPDEIPRSRIVNIIIREAEDQHHRPHQWAFARLGPSGVLGCASSRRRGRCARGRRRRRTVRHDRCGYG